MTPSRQPGDLAAHVPLLFSASIFLYPFSLVGHVLYVIPQFLIVLLLLPGINWNSRSAVLRKFALLVFAGGAIAFSAIGEMAAEYPSFDLVSKLFINGLTLCVVCLAGKSLVSESTIRHLYVSAALWSIAAIGAYVASGTGADALAILLVSPDEIGSTGLYRLASPLEGIFLTKNISAMFVVAVFSLFLCLNLMNGRKPSTASIALFLFTIVVFASRQAILACLVVLILYRMLAGVSMTAVISVLAALAAAAGFFVYFFDLGSSEDGASQRLQLWGYFFDHFSQFAWGGYGLDKMNATLEGAIGIDNFHMFFMNQIGAYGLIHFALFSCLSALLVFRAVACPPYLLLVAGYYLNVLFQTYGYEYGNLFLFMVIASQLQWVQFGPGRVAAHTPRKKSMLRPRVKPLGGRLEDAV